MEYLTYVLWAVLFWQVWNAGILPGLIGLVVWTAIWAVIALVHNLFVDEANAWDYVSFWKAIFVWPGSVSDYVHLNIGVGFANLALFSLKSVSKEQPPKSE